MPATAAALDELRQRAVTAAGHLDAAATELAARVDATHWQGIGARAARQRYAEASAGLRIGADALVTVSDHLARLAARCREDSGLLHRLEHDVRSMVTGAFHGVGGLPPLPGPLAWEGIARSVVRRVLE